MPMRISFSSKPSNRSRSSHGVTLFSDSYHPEPPVPNLSKTPSPRPAAATFARSASSSDRALLQQQTGQDNRQSTLISAEGGLSGAHSPDSAEQAANAQFIRSQASRKDGETGKGYLVIDGYDPNYGNQIDTVPPPVVLWSQENAYSEHSRPSPISIHQELEEAIEHAPVIDAQHAAGFPPNNALPAGADMTQQPPMDRFTQRRLHRLNTEQDFRAQRQNGNNVMSPIDANAYQSPIHGSNEAQPQSSHLLHPAQPHPATSQQFAYQAPRTAQLNQQLFGIPSQHTIPNNQSRPLNHLPYDEIHIPPQSQLSQQQIDSHQFPLPDSGLSSSSQESVRPGLASSRTFSSPAESIPMSGNGGLAAPKAQRLNRQSVHNGNGQSSTAPTSSAYNNGNNNSNSSADQPSSQNQSSKNGQSVHTQPPDSGRSTVSMLQAEEMTPEGVAQLIKEHKELRDKYGKVKKYYFDKEDQVKQLQNSLAVQRLSQSRTSLDDSEYATRFNRLDGLISQLAFSIRKEWKTLPAWLLGSVNKDAISVGKQEMTAAGRAFISSWLVREFFERCFHPDLDPALSTQMRSIQTNIRRYAPVAQTAEEREYLTTKIINWRLATIEGLQDALRGPQCATNRQQLTDLIKEQLVGAISQHMGEPPPADLEGGVHMIVELVVSIAIHLPLESRDVVIEYFQPGQLIIADQMKLETTCPPLITSIADDTTERASLKSSTSEAADVMDSGASGAADPVKKRSMLSAITGSNSKTKATPQVKHAAASGSSSSLSRPDSSHGPKEDPTPRVRMAAGIAVSVRGRSILVKAPVFAT